MKNIGRHVTYSNVMSTLAVIGVIAGSAFATAAVIGPDGEINACYAKKGGALEVSKKKKCGKGEKPISWNQKGPAGPQGPPGAVATWSRDAVAATGSITTASPVATPLADLSTPGPQVTVDVPASGLVELYAEAHVKGPTNTVGGIGVAIDGTPGGTSCVGVNGLIINANAVADDTYATGPAGGLTCGVALPGLPQSLMVRTTPGTHTFKLVYSALSNAGSATIDFSERRLYVAPRP
jgi:hypothetical protein